ncbi:MAG TPA: cytochrome c3 family protein [Thermoanaerobaculia bacterium]|nr:cytochrome c3 family protein [Thermoanaerobaculia bacterium]
MGRRRDVPLLVVLAVAMLGFGLAAGLPPASAQEADEAMAQGSMGDDAMMADDDLVVDVELCAACHDDVVTGFAGGPHSALDREGMDERYDISISCSACHGDATTHVEEGGGLGNIFSFNAEVPHTVQAGKCMECHGDSHPGFPRSPHAKAGLSCQSCHGIHNNDGGWAMLAGDAGIPSPMESIGSSSAVCSECHGAVFTQFEFNERHRLREGILDCQSCHDPHDAQPIAQLGGFKQQACVDCHGDKGGPFVFEHGSSRVEGCVACHTPHGSPNRHMLKFQSVAELCFSCHAAVPGFHARFSLETQCTNCHSSIHGSNFHEAFLK